MRKTGLLAVIAFGFVALSNAQQPLAPATQEEVIRLWLDGAPDALGKEPKDIPTLTVFLPKPDIAAGSAMVVCPGGGYGGLAAHEGKNYALWLNENGVAAFVLAYRLGSQGYRHPTMLHDAARAVRLVRARAKDWQINPKRIGIVGSSAGGHLASTLLTHFDAGNPGAVDPIERESSRPDVGILCYPVITMGANTHGGSRANLLGKTPSSELVQLLSNELQVTTNTPPTFLWHTQEDTVVKVENSLEFAAALNRAKVPFDLHVYQKGAHGIGLGSRELDPNKFHPWTRDCIFWLKVQGFVK
jgi:acetyl esterase/lipase